MILDVEVWKDAMDMCADLLACFSCTKDPDDGYLWCNLLLRWAIPSLDFGVKFGRARLVVVHTI